MTNASRVALELMMTDVRDDLTAHANRRLTEVAPGWAGGVSVTDDQAVSLELSHPYSEGFVIVSRPGLADDAAAAASWIDQQVLYDAFAWQVRLFADAPPPTGDGHAVRALRTFSELFEWANHETLAVAGLLVDSGALSDAEYEWARRTLGEDAPARPGPNPFPFRWHGPVSGQRGLRVVGVALDCADPDELAGFYERLLAATVLWHDDDSVGLRVPESRIVLELIRVADHRPPTWPDPTVPKQVHLELTAGEELDDAQARAVALGARPAVPQPDPDRWRVLLDPAGHPFCITTVTPPEH